MLSIFASGQFNLKVQIDSEAVLNYEPDTFEYASI